MIFHSDLENKVSHIVYRLRKNVKGGGERVPAQIEGRRWREEGQRKGEGDLCEVSFVNHNPKLKGW